MYKILTLIIVCFLITLHIYPQRNEKTRNGSIDSDRISRVEGKRDQISQIIYPTENGHTKTRNPETVNYRNNPIDQNHERINKPVVESRPIGCKIASPIYYTPPPPPIPIRESGKILFEQGDYWEASRVFTNALVNNPYDIEILFLRGRCYFEIEWYSFAIQDFDLVIDLEKTFADAYYFRGLAKLFRNERDLARIDLEIAEDFHHELAAVILRKYF